jgi:predicted nucleic acid-binding protein
LKQKAVPDTSFLTEHFRKGTVQDSFIDLTRHYHIAFSSVVLMELLSGAYEPKERRLIDQIRRTFTVLTVSERQWYICGDIMMKLRKDKKVYPVRVRSLLADILIAVSACDVGAVLITKNKKDFKLIKDVFDFKYLAVE